MDRSFQLVLDCLDTEEAPFSKGALNAFRQRLVERTLEVAQRAGAPASVGQHTAGALDWYLATARYCLSPSPYEQRPEEGIVLVTCSVSSHRCKDETDM